MQRGLMLIPVAMLAYVVTAHAGSLAAPGADGNGARIWDGVYTAAQVEQAKKPLVAVCRRCHSDDLGGSDRGPSLHGKGFMATWETQELSALFAKVRDTMPPDSPSSLPDEDYINMVALILSKNGFRRERDAKREQARRHPDRGKGRPERSAELSPGRGSRLSDARSQRRVDVDPHQRTHAGERTAFDGGDFEGGLPHATRLRDLSAGERQLVRPGRARRAEDAGEGAALPGAGQGPHQPGLAGNGRCELRSLTSGSLVES